MALRSAKQLLRNEIKQKIKALSDVEKKRQSDIVIKKVIATDHWQESSRVSIFLSMSDEIQTENLLKEGFLTKKDIFIPRYIGDSMEMVRLKSWQDYESLPTTSWNIKQPADDDEREDALTTGGLDFILMPGLAFSRQGDRMGRGRGYYDKYLQRVAHSQGGRKPRTVAAVYKEQIYHSVPVDDHDVPVDLVLFEGC
ncbi:hypothetical protein CAPTEDRAFT_221892 [Capitella teleta]|uniref:5-formyltetrahydrofolate cyclo-ligase n=1 Tax=Capitella teleta TaxID=283909 RepID=R7T3G1_CAPTE|nr:hypothetical protein CAPTEDRAFT_221892 [Capitella teleta]|eukprot:ELT87198.1 hypothetical protein CAPTEDRAFT_221892 [Capitella teleta]